MSVVQPKLEKSYPGGMKAFLVNWGKGANLITWLMPLGTYRRTFDQ